MHGQQNIEYSIVWLSRRAKFKVRVSWDTTPFTLGQGRGMKGSRDENILI
jgi:hypothetical protein